LASNFARFNIQSYLNDPWLIGGGATVRSENIDDPAVRFRHFGAATFTRILTGGGQGIFA
jgi:hypothetical protein